MGTKKSLANLLLLTLEKAVDGYVNISDFAYNPGLYISGMREVDKSVLSHALARLRKNGFIEFVDNKQLILRLTDSGKDKALWAKMKLEDEKWDGKWRIVIWDIPEKRKQVRDLLRYKLKQLGFQKFQKSVWASKKNCTKLLRDFIKQIGIGDWVMVIESDDIGR